MTVEVTKCSIAELKACDAFPALFAEYAGECALMAPDEKMKAYDHIEQSGYFQAFGAFEPRHGLVGFVAVMTPTIPHYGVCIATTESLFVGKAHRATGAGLKLLRAAERHAWAKGCPGIFVTAPHGGPLAEVLESKQGYVETNRVFLKKFGNFDHE